MYSECIAEPEGPSLSFRLCYPSPVSEVITLSHGKGYLRDIW